MTPSSWAVRDHSCQFLQLTRCTAKPYVFVVSQRGRHRSAISSAASRAGGNLMPLHPTSVPIALDRTGVAALREAVRLAAKAAGATSEEERQHLASIVFSFYRRTPGNELKSRSSPPVRGSSGTSTLLGLTAYAQTTMPGRSPGIDWPVRINGT